MCQGLTGGHRIENQGSTIQKLYVQNDSKSTDNKYGGAGVMKVSVVFWELPQRKQGKKGGGQEGQSRCSNSTFTSQLNT